MMDEYLTMKDAINNVPLPCYAKNLVTMEVPYLSKDVNIT
jgi:hypothetical protein